MISELSPNFMLFQTSNEKNWIFPLEDPMETPADVIKVYRSLLNFEPALVNTNNRIDGEFIAFRYKS
jgi:hypothetical protein